ncbi:MAG: hypothetical protein IPK93_10130 [Solirubrobacterales bacterium]|nr:hypothetical protein [Solirubrobacterales bacterium]
MNSFGRFIKVGVSLATVGLVLVGASSANAAGESVISKTSILPRASLYKDLRTPVDVRLEAKVIPGQGEVKLRELINSKLNLPTDLTFSTEGSEVCTKDIGQIDEEMANRPTAQVVADCPDSVVGGGTSIINVAGYATAEVKDPIVTIFNGGKDKDGDPILLMQGYSATVVPGGHGIPMRGVLKDGVLDVHVPPLAANSSVTEFVFNLPGTVGVDSNYVQSQCSTGSWTSNAVLTLGTYDKDTGQYTDKSDLATDPFTQSCTGVSGKAKFKSPKIKGPKKVKRGKKGTYKVTVKNTGTANAKSVKITAEGKGAKGSRNVGTIAPYSSKTVKVKVKFKKSGKSKVKFKVKAKGASAKTRAFKVKVK